MRRVDRTGDRVVIGRAHILPRGPTAPGRPVLRPEEGPRIALASDEGGEPRALTFAMASDESELSQAPDTDAEGGSQ